MEKFIGIVLCVFIGFYLLGKVLRFLFKLWINKKMRQFSENGGNGMNNGGFGGSFGGNFGGFDFRGFSTANPNFNTNRTNDNDRYNNEYNKQNEGKISVSGHIESKVKDNVGDYVDFEETK